MINNYPYFGLPNYLRYMNATPYARPTPRFYNGFTSSGFNNTTNTNINKRKEIPKDDNLNNVSNHNHAKSNSSNGNFEQRNCSSQDASPMFNLLGVNIYFDDILIVCILFFLYNENVNDPYLFLVLVLLLMS